MELSAAAMKPKLKMIRPASPMVSSISLPKAPISKASSDSLIKDGRYHLCILEYAETLFIDRGTPSPTIMIRMEMIMAPVTEKAMPR